MFHKHILRRNSDFICITKENIHILLNAYRKKMYSRSKKENETPLFISIQIIVQKLNWYQSSWISVYFSLMYLKFFIRVSLHGGSLNNFNFFNVNPQIFQWNRKVHLSNRLESNFHDIPNISLREIRHRNYS